MLYGGPSWTIGHAGVVAERAGYFPADGSQAAAAVAPAASTALAAAEVGVVALAFLVPATARAQNPPEAIEYYATDAVGSIRVGSDAMGGSHVRSLSSPAHL